MAAHKEYMAAKYHQLLSVSNITQLARLLKIGEVELYKLRFEKPYLVFEVKKQNGKFRLIEAPQKDLKKTLQELNGYLQCAYFFNRTPSAYGFILQPRNTTKKKSILSNAYRHCGKKFMLNIDLEDFFHQVSKFRIIKIFTVAPFHFPMELSAFLGELVTYKNRLPMGSPTSPSLSNFSTIGLDKDLEDFCKEQKITYTRYVDDLTFSSSLPIDSAVFYNIQQVLVKHTFRMNMDKIHWMGENDTKETTGLILKERPEVTASFLEELEKNLKRLKNVMEFSAINDHGVPVDWVRKFKEHLDGKLRFLQMIYGCRSEVYKKMSGLYTDAFNTQPFVESFNWNSFPYF